MIDFSVAIIQVSNQMDKSYTGNYLSQQLVRSSISPALNYSEAQSAESLKDFIHKLKISVKELRETLTALTIIDRSNFSSLPIHDQIKECNELISILVASIKTCQKKLEQG